MISRELTEALAEGQRLGAIGPGLLESHIQHAVGFVTALDSLPSAASVLDIGSGAGLPGLVLAELVPTAHITLLEGRELRAERLVATVRKLGLAAQVDVVGQRAEVAGRSPIMRAQFDAVVARGFARPAVTAECAAPFLRLSGLLVVSEPPDPEETERRWPATGCAIVGLNLRRTLRDPNSFAVLELAALCDDRYPRRTGIPEKRPLF